MDSSTDNSAVTFSIDERNIAQLSLNRPEKHNAFDDQMIATLRQHFDFLHQSTDVRMLIIQSAGQSFCAGADVAWMLRMAEYSYADNLRDARALAEMLQQLKTLPMPTIARVQGNAFGGALGLISCCDIAIAAENALFGLTETRIGLIPATIGPYVIEAIGSRWARRLFLSAERFSASLAERIDLIHESVSLDELDSRVAEITDGILRNSPQALREAKNLVFDLAGREVDAAVMQDTSVRIATLRVSSEGQEGLQAFLQKRSPAWTVSALKESQNDV